GGYSRYVVKNGDTFDYSIFQSDGTLIPNPPINVIKYIPPPTIDYHAMYNEALLNDNTYFANTTAAGNYFISKRVTEVIGGQTLKTIKIGTPSNPEFLYIDGSFQIDISPTNSDSPGSAKFQADGIQIEGGIYVSGNFSFNGGPTPPAY